MIPQFTNNIRSSIIPGENYLNAKNAKSSAVYKNRRHSKKVEV